MPSAVAYFRTSSAANVAGDSLPRQQEAVRTYAARHGLEIVAEFYDAAVSGADPVDQRPGFQAMINRIVGNGVRVILVEDPSRFARDLIVALSGYEYLKGLGVELVPVNAPDHFRDETPTATLIRQILGAVSQFEKAQTVAKLRAARLRTGRLGGPPKPTPEVIDALRRLPSGLTLAQAAERLAAAGLVSPRTGRPYSREAMRKMIAKYAVQAPDSQSSPTRFTPGHARPIDPKVIRAAAEPLRKALGLKAPGHARPVNKASAARVAATLRKSLGLKTK
jgi:DNA invertase Pin-like site-specific DNA recombinase